MAYPSPIYADSYAKRQQAEFSGYNHSRAAGDGEWYDMQNMTSADAPLLSVRKPRYLVSTLTKPNGVIGGDKLAWVDGTTFYYDGVSKGAVADSQKQMAAMGNLLIIFPDKKAYDITAGTLGDMEYVYTSTAGQITFSDGTYAGETAQANTLTTSGTAFSGIRVGDAVQITGCTTQTRNNLTIIVREISSDQRALVFYENSFVIGDGLTTYTEPGAVTIARRLPDLDFIFVHENRLWGAKGDSIWASALADPYNMYKFEQTGGEAWNIDVLDAGDYTAGISFIGYPVFFRSNQVYKIWGTIPADFRSVASANLGVAEGSGASLAISGEKLLYLSRAGAVLYSGGLPSPINRAFGDVHYKNGVAGTDGLLYYLSMQDSAGNWSLFVYDTQRGVWHRQDSSHAVGFAWCGEGLYMLCADGKLWFIGEAEDAPTGSTVETPLPWYVESADFTEASPQRKWLGRVEIRAEVAQGASFSVKVKYDNETEWNTLATFSVAGKRSYIVPAIPRRCDFYRIRIEGTGRVWIYSVTPVTEQGSEWH